MAASSHPCNVTPFTSNGSGLAIFISARRLSATATQKVLSPCASRLVDAKRRAQFEEEGTHSRSVFSDASLAAAAEDAARADAWLC